MAVANYRRRLATTRSRATGALAGMNITQNPCAKSVLERQNNHRQNDLFIGLCGLLSDIIHAWNYTLN
jgi:hypothetical protein